MNFKNYKVDREETPNKNVSSISIFWTFFRIGLFTLGGGLAMIPVLRHEIVIKNRWLKDSNFYSLFSLATAIPGAIAVNIAYLLGKQLGGKRGLLIAVFASILPSFVVILLIAGILSPYFYYPKVAAFLHGCSIAVVGQLAFASFVFAKRLLIKWQYFIVCTVGLIIIGVFKIHPIWGLVSSVVLCFTLFPYKKK